MQHGGGNIVGDPSALLSPTPAHQQRVTPGAPVAKAPAASVGMREAKDAGNRSVAGNLKASAKDGLAGRADRRAEDVRGNCSFLNSASERLCQDGLFRDCFALRFMQIC